MQTQKPTVMCKQLIWLQFIHKPDHYVLHYTSWFYLVIEFLYTSGPHLCRPEKQLDSDKSPITWTCLHNLILTYVFLSKDLRSEKKYFSVARTFICFRPTSTFRGMMQVSHCLQDQGSNHSYSMIHPGLKRRPLESVFIKTHNFIPVLPGCLFMTFLSQ